jgi:hypothetical protein
LFKEVTRLCKNNILFINHIFLGSSQTWYGELDLIAGNQVESANVSNIIVAEEIFRADTDVTETQNDEDFNDSPGEKTNVEVKQKIVDIKQVISQSVVFAFTEYNRHPTKGAFIPSIVVSRDCFCFVIYNPVMDLLLVSGDIEYSYDNVDELDENNFCRAFIFIWIIVNHRAFFRPDVPFAEKMIISNKSSFHKIMEGPPNELHCYNKLKDYASHINLDGIEKSRPRIGTESSSFQWKVC